jgi:hypothetical protein
MVKWVGVSWLMAAGTAAVVSCQLVAGISDRELVVNPAPSASASNKYFRHPPERTDAGAFVTDDAQGSTKRMFVVNSVFMGTVDPETKLNDKNAWRKIGYDIDQMCTSADDSTSDQSGVCEKAPGAWLDALEDGNDCRDNNLGKLLIKVQGLIPNFAESEARSRISRGDTRTLLLVLEDLSPGPDDPYVPGKLYVVLPPKKSTWNANDTYVVDALSVNGSIEQPKYTFPNGYLRDNVWVSGDLTFAPATLPFMFLDYFVEIPTRGHVLALEFSDGQHQNVMRSTLAGAMEMKEATAALGPVATFAMGCSEVLASLAINTQLVPNTDLGASSNHYVVGADAASTMCELISFGLMFEWVRASGPEPNPASGDSWAPTCDGGVEAGGVPDAGQDAGQDGARDSGHDSGPDSADSGG